MMLRRSSRRFDLTLFHAPRRSRSASMIGVRLRRASALFGRCLGHVWVMSGPCSGNQRFPKTKSLLFLKTSLFEKNHIFVIGVRTLAADAWRTCPAIARHGGWRPGACPVYIVESTGWLRFERPLPQLAQVRRPPFTLRWPRPRRPPPHHVWLGLR